MACPSGRVAAIRPRGIILAGGLFLRRVFLPFVCGQRQRLDAGLLQQAGKPRRERCLSCGKKATDASEQPRGRASEEMPDLLPYLARPFFLLQQRESLRSGWRRRRLRGEQHSRLIRTVKRNRPMTWEPKGFLRWVEAKWRGA